ncbi:hypothetical protein EYF80_014573 [Liparis tanakae]|uniref:Uncharacterized protein n=1 Tax=Liparis tanakae TaxID=230148 RepID=A0A4Z2IDU2_9TELE|nr:hypothetical protein EYF80_014573 [Liparis tanakae]
MQGFNYGFPPRAARPRVNTNRGTAIVAMRPMSEPFPSSGSHSLMSGIKPPAHRKSPSLRAANQELTDWFVLILRCSEGEVTEEVLVSKVWGKMTNCYSIDLHAKLFNSLEVVLTWTQQHPCWRGIHTLSLNTYSWMTPGCGPDLGIAAPTRLALSPNCRETWLKRTLLGWAGLSSVWAISSSYCLFMAAGTTWKRMLLPRIACLKMFCALESSSLCVCVDMSGLNNHSRDDESCIEEAFQTMRFQSPHYRASNTMLILSKPQPLSRSCHGRQHFIRVATQRRGAHPAPSHSSGIWQWNKLQSAWRSDNPTRRKRSEQLEKHKTTAEGQLQSLLFEAQVANVSLIDFDNTVVLLEETLLLGFPPALQTLHQQALRPDNDNTSSGYG